MGNGSVEMMDIRHSLNIKIESIYWDEAYHKALSDPEIPEWLTEEYVRRLHFEKGVLPTQLETIVSIIPHIVNCPGLCLLAKILYYLIGTKKKFSELFTMFELPKAPELSENTVAYDCFALFPVLAHIVPTWNELKSRGIPDNILTDSLHWVDSIFSEAIRRKQKPVFHMDEFRLYGVCIYVNHLTIGSLRFEIDNNSVRPVRIFKNKAGKYCPLIDGETIHKDGYIFGSYGKDCKEGSYYADIIETDDSFVGYTVEQNSRLVRQSKVSLSKKEWEQVYSSGDAAIKVHIPYGSKINKDACRDSYIRAKEIFTRCFPEYEFKCFLICCWMLSPLLIEFLSTDSNIINFQKDYVVFPMPSSALDVFLYVFGVEVNSIEEITLSDLSEKTSLQRAIKKQLLTGGDYIHQFGGYMPL